MPYSPTPSSDNLLLGKGEVFFSRRASGILTGYRHLGNVETFELTTTDDVLEKYSSMDAAASLYKAVTRKRDVVLQLTADEFDPDNLAMVLMGEVVDTAPQTATAVVAEVLTDSARLGAFYKFAQVGPHTGIAIKVGAVVLTLGTDYVIHDVTVGLIQILPNAPGVTAGDTITADYTPTAYATGLKRVRGGTQTLVEGAVLFVPDPTTGPQIMAEVWSVSVRPDGALGLISDEFAQMGMQMAVQADRVNHPLEPLYALTYLPEAVA